MVVRTEESTSSAGEMRQIGEILARREERIDARFDAVDARFDAMDARVDRMELANEKRFDRIDATLEQLRHLIIRDEKSSRRGPKKGGPNHS